MSDKQAQEQNQEQTQNQEPRQEQAAKAAPAPSPAPQEKVFAQGWCFVKIFVFFVLGCIIGTYYEEILWFIRFHERVNRQGIFYGPFSPIYGLGISIFVIFLGRNAEKRSWLKTWAWSALIGGCTEYATSLIAEKIFGSTIWDYSNVPTNINGRTTLLFMIFWGLGGMVLMKLVYPFISKWIEKIPYKIGQPVFCIALALMIVDLVLSYGAMGRRAMRDQGMPPQTFIGEFFDRVYPDEYIDEKIPAMVFRQGE